ncbi:Ubiquitin-like-specific protease ESD4 [Sesamum alatum]|uniref:Ubiquitin-like-specific protease ESD4 n=1 Tax=Sesamum alatum TaxID=300844 RepID=A0AAE1Y9K2_9LAMI|nr:Ubiquitin-like-specific protease ESD4 [Sesamum alatum]
MGALTNNRKRGDDYYKSLVSSSPSIDQSYGHISKKPKISVPMSEKTPENNRPASSNSVVSIISQYPDRKSGFPREVHAPVRNSRVGFFSSAKNTESTVSSKESPSDKMGKFGFFPRWLHYKNAKDEAVESLRYTSIRKQKEKEVIEVDSEDENRDDVYDDSSIEEVEIANFEQSKSKGEQGVESSRELNIRIGEKGLGSLDSSVITDVSYATEKVADVEKMELMQLDQVPDGSGVPKYKRLFYEVKRKFSKLPDIAFDIELHEKVLQRLQVFRPQKKEDQIKKNVAEECFVPLTDEEENEISRALSNSNRRKVLVTHENSNIDITGEILQCLRPGAWLNDEVINVYLELLKEREKREPQKFLKCHFFNTFFYKKLISGRGGYNFQSVRRWTTQRKLGYSLIECDKIFVPIHKEVHWCLAVINKKDEKFQYLDSLKGGDSRVLNVLTRYFVDEVKDKCGKDINVSSWEQEFVTDLPEQANGFDCGMFMIKYADFYSRDIGLCFSQKHMPYFRRRTAKEILKLRAD